jgi:hypothetical protein
VVSAVDHSADSNTDGRIRALVDVLRKYWMSKHGQHQTNHQRGKRRRFRIASIDGHEPAGIHRNLLYAIFQTV